MPTEPLQEARDRYGCPACGSMNTQRASTVAEDRIRNAIAAHWAEPPGPRGPDGRWLRRALVAWAGVLAFAVVTSTSNFVSHWQWAALLLGAVVLGTLSDRRAARRRGWIDPMQRATELARQARERDAAREESVPSGNLRAKDGAHIEGELVCLQCGHRFERTPSVVSAA